MFNSQSPLSTAPILIEEPFTHRVLYSETPGLSPQNGSLATLYGPSGFEQRYTFDPDTYLPFFIETQEQMIKTATLVLSRREEILKTIADPEARKSLSLGSLTFQYYSEGHDKAFKDLAELTKVLQAGLAGIQMSEVNKTSSVRFNGSQNNDPRSGRFETTVTVILTNPAGKQLVLTAIPSSERAPYHQPSPFSGVPVGARPYPGPGPTGSVPSFVTPLPSFQLQQFSQTPTGSVKDSSQGSDEGQTG